MKTLLHPPASISEAGKKGQFGRADLHMHTTYSDGMFNVPTLMNYLATLNMVYKERHGFHYLDVIAITDHDTILGSIHAKEYSEKHNLEIDVLLGSEISSSEGHIVAIDIKENIQKHKPASYTIDAIHEQGGLAIAAHPYSLLRLLGVRSVGHLIKTHSFDAVETVNSNITEFFGNMYTKSVNRLSAALPEVGNSDAHFFSAYEKVYTAFQGKTKQELLDSIRNKTTKAHGMVWNFRDLWNYFQDKKTLNRYCKNNNITPHLY